MVVVVLAVGGGGAAFWFDRPRLIKHVAERDHLAAPAAWVLARQGPPEEARAALLAAMEEGEPRLRAAAARALGGYRARDLVTDLGKVAMSDPDPAVRRAAVEGLDQIGESNAIPFVRKAMLDPDLGVQAAACGAVATYGLEGLIPAVIEHLDSPDISLRRAAKLALLRFLPEGQPGWEYDRAGWTTWYESGTNRR